jgi:hypothetical protein
MGLGIQTSRRGRGSTRLVVFSDDFGRHPSSCQHLVRQLLETNRDCCGGGCVGCQRYRVTWVNTLGTRTPELTLEDISRGLGKLRDWVGRGSGAEVDYGLPRDLAGSLTVLSPKMWPGFRRPWQRWLNAGAIAGAVDRELGGRAPGEERIAITTLPITADLVGRLDVDRWVYYCVDDFSVWPGLDSGVMQTMERELVGKVDEVVAVSGTLQKRIAGMGRQAGLLTHGIDRGHWGVGEERIVGGGARSRERLGEVPGWWPSGSGPVALFWGLIDRRLEFEWCRALSEAMGQRGGCLVLAGPEQNADGGLHELEHTVLPGAVGYDELPGLASLADVLVMPYVDAAVTRAMQPLKLKEYLSTDRPVVVRDLPATVGWGDCCDVVGDVGVFVETCLARAEGGLPGKQGLARESRLAGESWSQKAREFSSLWRCPVKTPMRRAA